MIDFFTDQTSNSSKITDHKIKLVGGQNHREGNVVIYLQARGDWFPVCDDDWDNKEVNTQSIFVFSETLRYLNNCNFQTDYGLDFTFRLKWYVKNWAFHVGPQQKCPDLEQ